MSRPNRIDLAIVGGGLAGALTALALNERRPELKLALIDAGRSLGGNHVWSIFDDNLDAEGHALIAPLIERRWPGYDIAFPAHSRIFETGYQSITSERLDRVVRERLGGTAWTETPVERIDPDVVVLADGREIAATGVIDARGPGDLSRLTLGWQKFLGQLLRLEEPHGLTRATVMDATVPQLDGYRFVYVLPFGPHHLFVEDTYYSDGPTLDRETLRERIGAYAAARGWRIAAVEREETGVLPVAMGGDFDAYWASTGEGVGKLGLRAGLFHPTTGYSLPDAVRAALRIAGMTDLSSAALAAETKRLAAAEWADRGFYRLLDRMLFKAAEPAERYKVLERFYRLDERLIGRFYAGRSTLADKARVLVGKPPVPISRAIRAIIGDGT